MIRMTGVFDASGYGVANKSTTMCLIEAGLEVSTQIIHLSMSRQEFAKDKDWDIIAEHQNSKMADINLVQLIPKLWHYGFQRGAYNIGYFFWESDKICDEWINIINNGLCNEVWVPCQSNYNALMNSKIKKPVYIVPQYTKVDMITREQAQKLLPIPNEGTFRFYSIFQWTQRKNPESLFLAYFNEFSNQDNVMLVVKTYGPSPFADKRRIKETILNIKEDSNSSAPVYLFDELMMPEQVNAIHTQCDCYVYIGRGEGWNIPLIESMTYRKQIITTKTGGIADWITSQSAYIIPHKLIPINPEGVWGAFYRSEPPQNWGDVDIKDIQILMRKAYTERNDHSERINNYDSILKVGGAENVIKTINERLVKIL